ncbi:MAG TPA: hypothetical protein VF067_09015 [Sphingomicrobium sp.]
MMLSFLAAILAGSVQASAMTEATDLSGLFQATCLDGQARLRANDVTSISFDQLPSGLRDKLGRPASGKVWQLNSSGHSYLYLLDYQAGPGISPKVCGLASDTMDLRTAGDALEMRVTGSVSRDRVYSAQWLNPTDGYVATATKAAPFSVLQISWMSDADREAALVQMEALPH